MADIINPFPQSDFVAAYPFILKSPEQDNWLESQIDLIKKRPYLYDHLNRVAYIATELADYFGIDPGEKSNLTQAGLLHDLGKIAIPEEIDNKNGSLTREEQDLMEKHVLIGYEMIKPHLPRVADIMLGHHWFQERKYPKILKLDFNDQGLGKMRQLVALADQTDSLLSERPYKSTWSVAETMTQLDKWFDKKLVDFAIRKRQGITI